jgi:hypothetical protein
MKIIKTEDQQLLNEHNRMLSVHDIEKEKRRKKFIRNHNN